MTKTLSFGEYVKERVYRVVIKYSNGVESSGSGFFINKKKFITCFHVIFGGELRNIRSLPEYNSIQEDNEHEKLKIFYTNRTPSVFVELENGVKVTAEVDKFSEFYDITILNVETINKSVNVCKVNTESTPTYGDFVSFGGFPNQFGYTHDTAPFAYTEGVVSSFPETTIGGENYEHIKVNAINLSGNSGAPLFLKDKKTVIGFINGNMNWGRDDLLVAQIMSNGQTNLLPVSLRVPLSIAYATSFKLIKEQTRLI